MRYDEPQSEAYAGKKVYDRAPKRDLKDSLDSVVIGGDSEKSRGLAPSQPHPFGGSVIEQKAEKYG